MTGEYILLGFSIVLAVTWVSLIVFSLFVYIPSVIKQIEKIQQFVAWPAKKLWSKIKSLIQKRTNLTPSNTLNNKFSAFSGFTGFVTFIFVTLLTLVLSFFVFDDIHNGTELLELALENTTMGACFLSISNQTLTTITVSLVIATGFSAAFSSFCQKAVSNKTPHASNNHTQDEETSVEHTETFTVDSAEESVVPLSEEPTTLNAKWYIKVAMFLMSFVAMIVLTIVLEDIFESVGNWGYRTIMDLFYVRGHGFFNIVGRIIALIFLGYVALLLLLSVVSQYLTYLAYFPLFLTVFGLVLSGVQHLVLNNTATSNLASDITVLIILFVHIFGVEILKSNDDGIRKKIRPIVNAVWRIIAYIVVGFFKLIAKIFILFG